ncbi:MAG TPA: OsmC family protein [Solirubrobacterales bacterium]|jgi:putative redox protein|nr:OsmC family protein [Solirubrobacterales bacterium]
MVVARRREGFAHDVEMEGGHTLVVDEPVEAGGTDTGPRPTQLLAASLAACTAITVEMYADRKGWDIGPIEVNVDVEHEGHVPSTFAVALKLPAELSDEQRNLLLRIAGKCPVHKVLVGEASVTVSERVEAL